MSTDHGPLVIGFDGSPDADLALRWGLRTAELTGRDLRVVVVCGDPKHLPPGALDLERQVAHGAATAARDVVGTAPRVTSTVVVEYGAAVPVLLRESNEASLLAVGSQGHGALESHLLGSVSQSLAGHAACPVAVIRPVRSPKARQILVGIDGSNASVRALAFATERAGLTGEPVLAVHAYQVPMFSGTGLGALPMDIGTEDVDASERLASELVAGVATDDPDVELRSTAVVGSAADVLVDLADRASLVVVGSRGRIPLSELVLGSVSQETLRHARCPVVVVP